VAVIVRTVPAWVEAVPSFVIAPVLGWMLTPVGGEVPAAVMVTGLATLPATIELCVRFIPTIMVKLAEPATLAASVAVTVML